MGNESQNEVLKKLSLAVIDYDDGDIMLVSDILDDIDIVKNSFSDEPQIIEVTNLMESLCNSIMDGEEDSDFIDKMSNWIELIIKLSNGEISEISKLSDSDSGDNKDDIDNDTDHLILDESYELDSETIKIFLVEAQERMISGQEIILELEDDMQNRKIIDDLFRIFHTIKGECGFLSLIKLGEITHTLETLLDMLRYNEIENNIEIIDIILNGVDVINELLGSLSNGDHQEYNSIDISEVVNKIESFTTEARVPIGQVLEKEGLLSKDQVEEVTEEQKKSGFKKKFGEIAEESGLLKQEDVKNSLKKQRAIQNNSDTYVKVSVNQINYLVDMVGELIIATNQIKDEDVEFLHKVTKEIQQTAMMLRTIKIKNLFVNMKRVVRDASKKLDKKVKLVLEGEDLEVDRNLVESLEEPLIHILRNSVGHGIEKPEVRIDNNKSEVGTVLLKAERVGNQIRILVRDDGAGLNKDKIVKKAISNGLISEDKASKLTDNEVFALIFSPGFSTSEVIDKVSGRGVGMDIVKTKVNNLRGHIGIKSELGLYSEFSLEFPLIMAIIDSMITLVDGVNFILPVVNIIETIKFEPGDVYQIKNREQVISLRDEVIPIIELRNFFDMNKTERVSPELAIIVEHNKMKYAFVVDQIVAKKEVVIKSLGDKLKNIKGISAATILSGGVIGYIININEIVAGVNQRSLEVI